MDNMTIIAVASIVIAGITIGFGTMGPALGEGRAVAAALSALASSLMPPLRSLGLCSWAWR